MFKRIFDRMIEARLQTAAKIILRDYNHFLTVDDKKRIRDTYL